MVAVGVGDEDVAHPLTGVEGGHDGIDVSVEQRAGIDDGDVAVAHEVGAGAEVGELARVLGHDPAHEGGDLLDAPVHHVEVPHEGDRRRHRYIPWRMKAMASARAAASCSKMPRTAEVTVRAPGFFTPRI